MASSSSTNPAYDVPSFNGRDRLIALHQEITNFLHHQSHVRYAATKSLQLHTSTANCWEWETIIEFLKEEHAHIKMLKQLLEMADDNTTELQTLFEDSPVNNDINWGEIAWGPMPQWEQPPPLQNEWLAYGSPVCIPQ